MDRKILTIYTPKDLINHPLKIPFGIEVFIYYLIWCNAFLDPYVKCVNPIFYESSTDEYYTLQEVAQIFYN